MYNNREKLEALIENISNCIEVDPGNIDINIEKYVRDIAPNIKDAIFDQFEEVRKGFIGEKLTSETLFHLEIELKSRLFYIARTLL